MFMRHVANCALTTIVIGALVACGRPSPAPTAQSCPNAQFLRVTNESETALEIAATKGGSSASSAIVLGTARPGITELPLINNSSHGYVFSARLPAGVPMGTASGYRDLMSRVHFDVACMNAGGE